MSKYSRNVEQAVKWHASGVLPLADHPMTAGYLGSTISVKAYRLARVSERVALYETRLDLLD